MEVLSELDRIEREQREQQAVPATSSALDFLQAVYRNTSLALPVRMRAAIEALPFESPKLSATAVLPGDLGFAERLERAVRVSRAIREPVKLIEGTATETIEAP